MPPSVAPYGRQVGTAALGGRVALPAPCLECAAATVRSSRPRRYVGKLFPCGKLQAGHLPGELSPSSCAGKVIAGAVAHLVAPSLRTKVFPTSWHHLSPGLSGSSLRLL